MSRRSSLGTVFMKTCSARMMSRRSSLGTAFMKTCSAPMMSRRSSLGTAFMKTCSRPMMSRRSSSGTAFMKTCSAPMMSRRSAWDHHLWKHSAPTIGLDVHFGCNHTYCNCIPLNCFEKWQSNYILHYKALPFQWAYCKNKKTTKRVKIGKPKAQDRYIAILPGIHLQRLVWIYYLGHARRMQYGKGLRPDRLLGKESNDRK